MLGKIFRENGFYAENIPFVISKLILKAEQACLSNVKPHILTLCFFSIYLCMPVCVCLCLSVCLSVCMSASLSLFLPVCPSFIASTLCLSLSRSFLPIDLSVADHSLLSLSVYVFVCLFLSVCLFVTHYVYLSFRYAYNCPVTHNIFTQHSMALLHYH